MKRDEAPDGLVKDQFYSKLDEEGKKLYLNHLLNHKNPKSTKEFFELREKACERQKTPKTFAAANFDGTVSIIGSAKAMQEFNEANSEARRESAQ